jgi:pilus assembly protein CpaC
MKWFTCAITLVFLMQPAWADEPGEGDTIRVIAGEQFDLQTSLAVRRVAVGDTKTADVTILGNHEILILGKKPGVTSMLMWAKNSGQPKRYRIQVEDALQHQMALKVAENLVMEADKTGIPDRSPAALSGQVQVDVRIVEMSKKVLKETGIGLVSQGNNISVGVFSPGSLKTASLSAAGIATDASVPVAEAFHLVLGSTTHGILGVLALLERNGLARTLAQPSMSVVSGQTASFMAGGEFPIPIAQSLGQVTISYKPYGIRLTLTPTVFSKDRIAIKLAPEVSELDFTNAVTSSGVSVPGILTRRAETTIELGDGESFVIAGLISRSFVDTVDKVPGLGDLPVLGAFFRSTRFSREDKELVIIATPTLVRPLAANAELPPLPGAEYEQANPSWTRQLFYGDLTTDDESVGLSR